MYLVLIFLLYRLHKIMLLAREHYGFGWKEAYRREFWTVVGFISAAFLLSLALELGLIQSFNQSLSTILACLAWLFQYLVTF